MLARRGLGQTWPNPSVGTVIANTSGDILGRGQTAPGGRPHAEAVALEQAGKRTKGATLYVTLEPCAHVGRGAPCADAIANAKPARVVAAMRVRSGGLPLLLQDSQAVCAPNGTPVNIVMTQFRVKAQ